MTSKINLNFDFPQVDLPNKVLAFDNITQDLLNLYKQACKLKAGIFALCLEGSMKAAINLIDYTIQKGDFITLLPGTIIQFKQAEAPLRLCFIGFSSNTISQINFMEVLTTSYHKMVENPVIPVQGNMFEYIHTYFSLWAKMSNDSSINLHPNIITHAMHNVVLTTSSLYADKPFHPIVKNRQEEIYRDLLQLITKYYTRERSAQFYADKLEITPQHLSTTIRQVTGGTVLDLIAHVVIMDAKSKLKSTNMSVQEIAYALNFPTPSFFGKYFKRYVGTSPLAYKQQD